MPCTTFLVGKNASNDHTTMISRTATTEVLGKVLKIASMHMENGYSRADH